MGTKSYDQYCTIATALDMVGDRWSLLVLRELSFGEQRFTDLKAALPGVATNLLTDRLRSLEEHGLIEKRDLPAPAARTVYGLTRAGTRVRPVLRAVAQFGMPYLPPAEEGTVRPVMAVYGGAGTLFDPVAAVGTNLQVKFVLDGEEHWLAVRDGKLRRADPSRPADLTVTGSAAALFELSRGVDLEALSGQLTIEGSSASRKAFARCFPAPAAPELTVTSRR